MLNKAVYQRKRKSKVRDSILLFGSNIFSLSHAREKKKKSLIRFSLFEDRAQQLPAFSASYINDLFITMAFGLDS